MGHDPGGRWRSELEAWAIPQDLLDAAEESPYGWPPEIWARRSDVARADPTEPPTAGIVRSLLGESGLLLDIGAGRGRASLDVAAEGHRLIAVERDAGMAAGLREEAARLGVQVTVVEGPWPDIEGSVPPVDLAMSAHVVYDVQGIVPFLGAMVHKARRAVVVELTETHPWANLAPYYRALHGLDRPDGPTADDLVEVVDSVFGVAPNVVRWRRGGQLWYQDWDELLGLVGRRLVLPRRRWPELRALLEGSVTEAEGRLHLGDVRELVTVWWEVGGRTS